MNTNTDYAAQMKRFGEENNYGGSGFRIDEFMDAGVYDGLMVLSVDCYSLLGLSQIKNFNDDLWEAMTLRLEQVAGRPTRTAWREAYSLARSFVQGNAVRVQDGPEFTLSDWAESRIADFLDCSVAELRAMADREGWRADLDRTLGRGQAAPVAAVPKYVTEEDIAAALGCTVAAVRERAEREGWPHRDVYESGSTDPALIH